jgi:ATP/maltotriose-dependent transcriptional regulator MalT
MALRDFDSMSRVLATIGPLWENHEYLAEGLHYTTALLTSEHWRTGEPDVFGRIALVAGNCARHQGQYQLARRRYRAGLSKRPLTSQVRTALWGGLGEAAFRQGRYAEARAHYRRYQSVSLAGQNPTGVADALTALARIELARGHAEAANRLLETSHVICQAQDYALGTAWLHNARGELHRAGGLYSEAIDDYQASLTVFAALDNPGAERLVRQNLMATLIASGRFEAAEQGLPAIMRFWRRGGAVHPLMLGSLCWSSVLAHQGDLHGAARLLLHVERRLAEIGVVLELGDLALYQSLRSRLQHSLTARQWSRLRAAARAGADDTIVDATIGRDDGSRSDGPLSPREREILELIARGHTDRQIAAHCRISPHTVNAHLRKIYARLEVGSRTEAVFVARQSRLI